MSVSLSFSVSGSVSGLAISSALEISVSEMDPCFDGIPFSFLFFFLPFFCCFLEELERGTDSSTLAWSSLSLLSVVSFLVSEIPFYFLFYLLGLSTS